MFDDVPPAKKPTTPDPSTPPAPPKKDDGNVSNSLPPRKPLEPPMVKKSEPKKPLPTPPNLPVANRDFVYLSQNSAAATFKNDDDLKKEVKKVDDKEENKKPWQPPALRNNKDELELPREKAVLPKLTEPPRSPTLRKSLPASLSTPVKPRAQAPAAKRPSLSDSLPAQRQPISKLEPAKPSIAAPVAKRSNLSDSLPSQKLPSPPPPPKPATLSPPPLKKEPELPRRPILELPISKTTEVTPPPIIKKEEPELPRRPILEPPMPKVVQAPTLTSSQVPQLPKVTPLPPPPPPKAPPSPSMPSQVAPKITPLTPVVQKLAEPPKKEEVKFDVPKKAVENKVSIPVVITMPRDYIGVVPKTEIKKKEISPVPVKPPPPPPPKKKPEPPKPEPPKKSRKIPVIAIVGALFVAVLAIGSYFVIQSISTQTPEPLPVNTNTTPPVVTPPPVTPPPTPEPIRSGIDTDSDGLTDVEEIEIFQSNLRNSDSDNDSFIDGNEVLHLYDPDKKSGSLLENSPLFSKHRDPNYNVEFLVPEKWEISLRDDGVEFNLSDGENITVNIFPGDGNTNLKSYAALRFVGTSFEDFTTKSGLAGVHSQDGRIILLKLETGIVAMTYSLNDVRTIEFLRTFEMMVNSFSDRK